MKIIRIADNAINVYISDKDLALRNLDAKSLKEGTQDFNKLVWDAIDHANIEFGHEFEYRQLCIINKYDGNGGLVLTISHYSDPAYGDDEYIQNTENDYSKRFDSLFFDTNRKNGKGTYSEPQDELDEFDDPDENDNEYIDDSFDTVGMDIDSKSKRRISEALDIPPEELQNLLNKIHLLRRSDMQKSQYNTPRRYDQSQQRIQLIQPPQQPQQSIPPQQRTLSPIKFPSHDRGNSATSDWDILIFPEMNDMLEFFARNKSFKGIGSSLYTYRGAYYLVLKPNNRNLNTLNRLEALVIDYNATYLPAESFLPLLKERGTILMESGAISKLINNFGL